jgi:hypothetical protein
VRTPTDALRSLKRYVALGFPGWEVRMPLEEGTFGRPSLYVKPVGPPALTGPAHAFDTAQRYTVYGYPRPGATAPESLMAAEECRWALVRLFRVGIPPGAPLRVPLFDYAGIPLNGAADEATRFDRDFMRADDPSADLVQLPDDERLFTVTAEIRMSWRSEGRVASGDRMVRELRPTFKTTG